MKTLKLTAIIMVMAVSSISACKQTRENAPVKVRDSFTKKFPKATDIKWDKENETEWEAEFDMNGKEYSANFSTNGAWKETEYGISKSDIPSVVKITLDSNFAGYEIEEAEISETSEATVYEFELENGETVMEVAISPSGRVVRKEVKQEDDDEVDD